MPKIRVPPKLYYSKKSFEDTVDPRVVSVFELKQYKQRTKGWYKARGKCITASSASSTMLQSEDSCGAYIDYYNLRDNFKIDPKKTCSHKETQMEFILNKCGLGPDFKGNEYTAWGQKYEQIVSNIYSQIHQVDMLEFGLIRHPTIDFLGASPDGITTQGRMLEIKCPPCRQVKNYPPLYYWQQMQLQLICTNLQECDYFDAHFVQYVVREDWENDARQWELDNKDAKHHIYGIILSYPSSGDSDSEVESDSDVSDDEMEQTEQDDAEDDVGADDVGADDAGDANVDVSADEPIKEEEKYIPPNYIYAEPNIVKVDEFIQWMDETIEKGKSEGREITPVFYKLHEYYISRAEVNHEWFAKNLPSMKAVWEQVLEGRTKKGKAVLIDYVKNKSDALADKRAKKKAQKEANANLEVYIDLDITGAQETYTKTGRSTYVHKTCLL